MHHGRGAGEWRSQQCGEIGAGRGGQSGEGEPDTHTVCRQWWWVQIIAVSTLVLSGSSFLENMWQNLTKFCINYLLYFFQKHIYVNLINFRTNTSGTSLYPSKKWAPMHICLIHLRSRFRSRMNFHTLYYHTLIFLV